MPIGKKAPLSGEQALAKLRDLCNRGEYCTWELKEKMRKWGVGSDTSGKIISLLEKDRLVDDSRYAEVIAHSKNTYSHWGKYKIILFLKAKHISGADIKNALESIREEDYIKSLRQVIVTKKRQLGEEASTYEGRNKILRYAASKGFEPELIISVMKENQEED